MMSVTHAAIAITTTSITLGTDEPFVLGIAAVTSQLPDLDSTKSYVGQMLYPIAHWIEERYPHRSVTHSFMATGIVAGCSIPLLFIGWSFYLAAVIGHFCGWFSDCFTKSGVVAFYPNTARLVIPGNPRWRLDRKSPAEYWILASCCFLTIASIQIISAGGMSDAIALSFFNDSTTAAETFHKYGAERSITIDVEGIHRVTSQEVAGTFTVIEATQNDVIAESHINGQLYKIGSGIDVQIQPTAIRTRLGDRITIHSQTVDLQETPFDEVLNRLPQNAYLSGSLLVDDLEEAPIQQQVVSYPTLQTYGNQLDLSNARPIELSQLRDFWILYGRLVVKVREL
jgi:inner membrane protein